MLRLISCLSLAAVAAMGSAQIPGLKLPGLEAIPGLDAIFKKGPAITTSLRDCKWEKVDMDTFTMPESKSLMTLQRTPNGGFVLQPGGYTAVMQSYCLKAGTHGPGGGDGYLYAPPKGPYEALVMTVVRNSVQHPEIPQH